MAESQAPTRANTRRVAIGAAVVVVALLTVAVLIGRQRIHISVGASMIGRFSTMPPDDEQLAEWLKAQPGVVDHTVHFHRADDGLWLIYTQVRNLAGDPPPPDINRAATEFGYHGGQGFRDSPDVFR